MKVRLPLVLLVAVLVVSCSKNNPAAPTPTPTPTPTPAPAPAPSTFSLNGRVTNATTGAGVSGATVAASGLNAGRSTTTASDGSYTLSPLTAGTFNVGFNAQFYLGVGQLVMLTSNQTLNQAITFIPPFAVSGVSDNVFTIPSSVTRIRITGHYAQSSSNFIVHIAGEHIVNELLGTFWGQVDFAGTYVTRGGVVEILSSSGVQWTFTEVRP